MIVGELLAKRNSRVILQHEITLYAAKLLFWNEVACAGKAQGRQFRNYSCIVLAKLVTKSDAGSGNALSLPGWDGKLSGFKKMRRHC